MRMSKTTKQPWEGGSNMANYEGMIKSNDFRLDPNKFEQFTALCNELTSECPVYADVTKGENGEVYGSVACYSDIEYYDEETDEYDTDIFYEKLKECIAEDDAAIFIETGHEKLRYLGAFATIVTSKTVEYLNLDELAEKKAKELLAS